MNPTIYLHIGQPKTATSFIQKFMFKNHDRFKRKGVLYPRVGNQLNGHHPIAGIFLTPRRDWIEGMDQDRLRADLFDEISRSGCDTILLSSEALAQQDDVDFEKVKAFFAGCRIRIVMTLRRQDDWLESVVRDRMKTGHYQSPAVEDILSSVEKHADFATSIETWASHFGNENIVITIFDPGNSETPVEKSFVEAIGADLDRQLLVPSRVNERLNQDCIAFLMSSSDKRRIFPFYRMANDILAIYSRENPDPVEYRYVLSPKQRRRIMMSVSEGNAEVARKHLGKADGILFDTASPIDAAWRPYPGLSVERSTEIGIYLSRKLFWELVSARESASRN